MEYILIFLVSFILTVVFTPLFSSYLKKLKLFDIPGGRHLHEKAIPRMGGFVVFIVTLGVLNAFVDDFASIHLLVFSVIILLICGILDDILGLSSLHKLMFQTVSAGLMILYIRARFSYLLLFGITFVHPYDYILLFIFIVGSINAVNLLDGLDGLAGGFSVLVFTIILALSLITGDSLLATLCCALIGGLLGFLRFNAHPASIFLGDTGSLSLGYFLCLASIMIALDINKSCLDLTFSIYLLAVPLIDTMRVFIQRVLKNRSPFSPDLTHLHHLIFKSDIRHEITVFIIELFTLLFLILSMIYFKGYCLQANIMFVAFSSLLISVRPVLGIFRNLEIKFAQAIILSKDVYFKTRMFISTAIVMLILILSFPAPSSLHKSENLFMIAALLILVSLFSLNYIKTGKCLTIPVFLNFLIYFILNKLKGSSTFFATGGISGIGTYHDLSFYILTILIIAAILRQKKPAGTAAPVFKGMDLTLVVLIILLFFINKTLYFDFNFRLSISLLEAFIFYAYFKILASEYKKCEIYFSYFSFLPPLFALIL
jgi:UDP-GlcNAc:undecaprenyl-phosphate GlcNAc-1-phosphate transferase